MAKKAFLSHLSADKSFVSKVYEYLGAARAHYDAETFDGLGRSHEVILRALRDCSVFVLFVPREAPLSPWIAEEIKIACDPAQSGAAIDRIAVLMHGASSRQNLPDEMKYCSAIQYSDPWLVARKIEEFLLRASGGREGSKKPFVGREDDLKALSTGIAPAEGPPPNVVIVSGLPGVGRKTLLRRAIEDNYPFMTHSPRAIPVSKGGGLPELFFSLSSGMGVKTLSERVDEADRFSALDEAEQINELSALMAAVAGQRDPIVLDDACWLLSEAGEISDWFLRVLRALPRLGYPQLLLVSSRALSARGIASLDGSFFYLAIRSLSTPNTARLLKVLLEASGLKLPANLLPRLLEVIDGHPDQVIRSANLLASLKGSGIEFRGNEIVDALSRNAEAIISIARLDSLQSLAVKLFNEFEYLTGEDLAAALGEQAGFEGALVGLMDLCFVERVGEFYRLAPSVARALVRMADNAVEQADLVGARLRIAERLNRFSADDLVEFSVLEKSVAAWVRSSRIEPPFKAARMLLPASLLRSSQRAYDSRDWEGASEFAARAIDGEWKLSPEALCEAYRLAGLSLARLGEDQRFDSLLASLRSSGRVASSANYLGQRIGYFLVGFKARLDGNYALARENLLKAAELSVRPNFSILRECADVLLKLGEYESAKEYAEKALAIAPTNPFVLAKLVDILDRMIGGDGLHPPDIEQRREELIEKLRQADAVERTSFSLLRDARELAGKGMAKDALRKLDLIQRERDVDPIVLGLVKARVYLQSKDFRSALSTASELGKLASRVLGKRAVEHYGELDYISVRSQAELGLIEEAKKTLGRSRYINPREKAELERMLGFAQAMAKR